jgi:hypothetical protein
MTRKAFIIIEMLNDFIDFAQQRMECLNGAVIR